MAGNRKDNLPGLGVFCPVHFKTDTTDPGEEACKRDLLHQRQIGNVGFVIVQEVIGYHQEDIEDTKKEEALPSIFVKTGKGSHCGNQPQ